MLSLLLAGGTYTSRAQAPDRLQGPNGAVVIVVPGLDVTALTLMAADEELVRPALLFEDRLRRLDYRPRYAGGWTHHPAGNMSALATGRLTGPAVMGRDENRRITPNILEQASDQQVGIALVSPTSLLSPELAAFYSHQSNQQRLDAIGKELLALKPNVVIGSMGASSEAYQEQFRKGGYIMESRARRVDQLSTNRDYQAVVLPPEESQRALQGRDDFYVEALRGALQGTAIGSGNGLIIMSMPDLQVAEESKSPELYRQALRKISQNLNRIQAVMQNRNMLLMIVGASPSSFRVAELSSNGSFKADWGSSPKVQLLPVWLMGPDADFLPPVVDNRKLHQLLQRAMH